MLKLKEELRETTLYCECRHLVTADSADIFQHYDETIAKSHGRCGEVLCGAIDIHFSDDLKLYKRRVNGRASSEIELMEGQQ